MHNKWYLMQSCITCVRKTYVHQSMNICRLFRSNYTKMLIKTTLSVLLSKHSLLWFHQRKISLFRPFLFSSKLDHTTCSDLLLVIEAWRLKDQFQFTERSFAVCTTYWHRQHYLQSKSKNVRRTSGRDNFNLHDLKLAFCKLESSRLIACRLHLNCTQLLNCHT